MKICFLKMVVVSCVNYNSLSRNYFFLMLEISETTQTNEMEWNNGTDNVAMVWEMEEEEEEAHLSASNDSVYDGNEDCGLDTEEPSLQSSALSCLANVDFRPEDVDEGKNVLSFFEEGCGCSKWNGKNCIHQFSQAHVSDVRLQCFQLTHQEQDMMVFGQLLAHADNSEATTAEQRHPSRKRSRMHSFYYHQGKPICLKTFLFMHTIGMKRFKNITKSFQDNGVLPRIHGNTHRLPWNSLSFSSIQHVISFLVNYTEENGLLLPGRLPGYFSSDLKLLPSSRSRKGIWKLYEAASNSSEDIHIVAYKTFCRLWRTLLPSIIIMRPMSDLCWVCQQNSTIILRSANSPEPEKRKNLKKAMEHLNVVTGERSFYRSITDECRRSIQSYFAATNGLLQLPSISSALPTNSKNIKVHYSFDYAQMVC